MMTRILALLLLLGGVALAGSGCVFVPVGRPGYAAAPPPVYVGPPAVVVAPGYGWHRYRHW